MTIGLICAIPEELAHLRSALQARETLAVARASFDRGTLDGHEVVLAGAGIGKVNTALVATLLADRFGCRMIVFSGVAGGLDPDLAIGDVVIADRTLQHDAGVIEAGRLATYQAGHVPFFNPTDALGYPVDPALLGRLRQRLDGFALPPLSRAAGGEGRAPRIVFGRILSGDQYIAASQFVEEVRRQVQRQYGQSALEEGGLSIRSTLDTRLQLVAARVLRAGLDGRRRALGGLAAVGLRAGPAAALGPGVAGLAVVGPGFDDHRGRWRCGRWC